MWICLQLIILNTELHAVLSLFCFCTVPNVELPALCSPRFRSGPPSELAQTASLFLQDAIVK